MSYINTQYKHIFIHVPKTGGTSMYRQPFVLGGGHQTAAELVPEQPEWFSWGFVRNPYDRLFSIYNAATQHRPKWQGVDVSFPEFVLQLEKTPMVRPHTHPMSYFLCDQRGKVLVKFVGRFEKIDEDWAKVCEQIGVAPTPMKHLNSTHHGPWQKAYNKAAIKAVNRMYEADFHTFGYEMI